MIRIVLADDHQAVRKCLHKLIIAEPDFVIVGEAADGLEALDLVSKLEPDVLVLDLSMEGMNGLEVTRKLHNMKTKTKIVMLSLHSNNAYIFEALRAGVHAYVFKDDRSEEMIKAVRDVICNRIYLSSQLADKLDLLCDNWDRLFLRE